MANFYGIGRTNYFRVKDPELFENDMMMKYSGIEVQSEERQSGSDPSITEKWFCLLDNNQDGGGWCILLAEEEAEEETDTYPSPINLEDILSEYLVDTDVAVIIQVGYEKYNYAVGTACAVNSKGETVNISIDDIYGLASTLGPIITQASY